MDGATIYGIVTGSTGTGLSLYLLYRTIATERSKLSPDITDWVTVGETEGHLVIKARVVAQN